MQAVALSGTQALALLAEEHRLVGETEPLRHEFVAASMRRQFARMYPCDARQLLSATRLALQPLVVDKEALADITTEVLDDLQTCGDIVELSRMTVAQDDDRSQWLFPAPPGFVVRDSRIYLLGIAPDDAPFLPSELWQRVQINGASRFLNINDASAPTAEALLAFGLRQLSESEWLGDDRVESAQQHLDQLRERLRRDGVDGPLPGMMVLSHQDESRASYQRRWVAATTASGLHIVRLEQPYGSPLWYLAALSAGRCTRSLLLPHPLDTSRACDQAWRAQLAIDAAHQHEGRYTVRQEDERAVFRFDFPLPLSARRRLLFVGGPTMRGGATNSFALPPGEERSERRYLEEHLWLKEAKA